VSVYIGQGIVPETWDQRADAPDSISLGQGMDQLKGQIRQAVAAMPDHAAFIARRNATIAEPAR
jgi:tryptophan halogenase